MITIDEGKWIGLSTEGKIEYIDSLVSKSLALS